jgi:hypothetical protein
MALCKGLLLDPLLWVGTLLPSWLLVSLLVFNAEGQGLQGFVEMLRGRNALMLILQGCFAFALFLTCTDLLFQNNSAMH